MGTGDAADLLASLGMFPLFTGLPEDLLAEVAGNLRYLELDAGEALLRQGEPGDALYLVVDGCLEARLEHGPGAPRVLGTAGRGSVVGEMAVISGAPRSCSMYAVRESGVLRLAQADLQRILEHHPRQLFRLTTQIIERAARGVEPRPPGAIALLPASPAVDLAGFAQALVRALGRHRPARLVTAADAARRLGPAILQEPSLRDPRLLQWLADEERAHPLVVYQAEAEPGGWTRRCLAQADLVLVVADAEDRGEPREAERSLLWGPRPVTEAPVELALLHRDGREPAGTRRFLTPRPRLRLHHHVRPDAPADLERLGRLLTGNGVMLVLSGGGARGLCHIGVLRAFEDLGVPVDFVGGTSVGSFFAAMAALGWTSDRMEAFARESLGAQLQDLTLPLLSLIRGQQGTRLTRATFGERRIEDLRVSYFALSADLCAGEEVVHRGGPLWRAIRASVAIPGFVPPLMDGDRCLVDGGVLNNLPTDVMDRLYPGRIVAVDAAQGRRFDVPAAVPLDVAGWRMLLRRLNPLAPRDLHIGDVLMRSAEIASARPGRGGHARVALTLRPPVHAFRMLDFRPVRAIAEVTYRHVRGEIAAWWREASGARLPLHE